MKVRHRPTVVDAVIWDGSLAALDEMAALGIDHGVNEHGELVINTLEGPRVALMGDAAMLGTQGESYINKPDVFAACYERDEEGVPVTLPGPDAVASEIGGVELEEGTAFTFAVYDDGRIMLEFRGRLRDVAWSRRADGHLVVALTPTDRS